MSASVYGHRGASIELPENTLEAFARALELGADIIETDVHVTTDGHVVIHHDETGLRTACARARVASVTLEEMRRWNVAFGFRHPDSTGIADKSYRVPLLSEALEAFPSTRFNIDIKPPTAEVDVLRVIDRQGAADRVLLTSFHDKVLHKVRASGYRGQTGLAQSEAIRALALPAWAPRAVRPRGDRIQLPVTFSGVSLGGEATIARLQKLGYRVDFWVVNDAATARILQQHGADGIMTDDPRTIVPALAVSH